MYDVAALGELLIDFAPYGKSQKGNFLFECNPGGAPANVLAALSKLGRKTAFIGKVGNDNFGQFLKNVLNETDIDTNGLVFSEDIKTTLAFVHLDEQGDRTFSFYRNPGADMMLNVNEIDEDIIMNSRIFHFGSVSMTDEPVRSATLKAVNTAKDNDKIISFDPNLRPALWKDLVEAKEVISVGMKYANIIKISEEELEFITDSKDLVKGTEILMSDYSIDIICVTLGSEGCFYRKGNDTGKISGYKVNTIDTTGAGDGFLGGLLYSILEINKNLNEISIKELEEAVRFANALGALATTKTGAIPAMPELREINRLMNNI
ncbi:MAG: carbohydrate kinase [Clostridiaceae bacterium]